MLHEFLALNRDDLIERCRAKVALRTAPKATEHELVHGIPRFLDQLIKTLRLEQTGEPLRSRRVSGPAGGGPVSSEIGVTASLHGRELSQQGFTVEQVVHDYGDLCQAITDLAFERSSPIRTDEFRTLNRCLDNGIADAVTEFAFQRGSIAKDALLVSNERLGGLAHELRNHLQTATLALLAMRAGQVGLSGATSRVLERSLIGMQGLIDRSLAEVRIGAGGAPHYKLISLADFIADVGISASLGAKSKGCEFALGSVEARLALDVDREMIFSAVDNLLQNAFKFTEPGTEVSLGAYASGGRIRIEVEDRCGGLPEGAEGKMFQPFAQMGEDHSGLGLGLSISRRGVEANRGTLSVRDIPGVGCVFIIDLPRHELPAP